MIDHLSEELRALYPGIPAEGEVRVYKLAGMRRRAVAEGGQQYVIPKSRSLPSSYPIIDEGRPKSIVYVERVVPTTDPTKMKQELGFIEFRLEDGGSISITKENYAQTMNIDMFLFFSPFLVGADQNPWYLKHKQGMFLQKESPETMAKDFLDIDMVIHEAKTLVYGFKKEMLGIMIDQLNLGHSARMSEREMQQKLIQYCDARVNNNAGGGAKRIITLSENKDVALRKLIKTAVAMGKIKVSNSQNEWEWVQGGEKICPKLPSKTLEDSMILFFVSDEGREVLGALKNMVKEGAKEVDKVIEKKPSTESLSDQFGPLKGSPEWDELSPNEKGALNKQRKEFEEKVLKDTSIPETPAEA